MDAETMQAFFEVKMALKDFSYEIENLQKDGVVASDDIKELKEKLSNAEDKLWEELSKVKDRLQPISPSTDKPDDTTITPYKALLFLVGWAKKWFLLIAAIGAGIAYVLNWILEI